MLPESILLIKRGKWCRKANSTFS